jgi:V8-like Glu-specific endopeptidase
VKRSQSSCQVKIDRTPVSTTTTAPSSAVTHRSVTTVLTGISAAATSRVISSAL